MKRLRLEDCGEKGETGQLSEMMGEKIKNDPPEPPDTLKKIRDS